MPSYNLDHPLGLGCVIPQNEASFFNAANVLKRRVSPVDASSSRTERIHEAFTGLRAYIDMLEDAICSDVD